MAFYRLERALLFPFDFQFSDALAMRRLITNGTD